MGNKIYCWHATHSLSIFNFETFGSTFGKDNFINNVYNELKSKKGILSYILFIVDFSSGQPKMYFSIDKKLYEMRNLMAYSYLDIEVYDIDSGRQVYDRDLLKARDYVSLLMAKNVGNINERIMVGKSLSFLEIEFNDAISPRDIQNTLKYLFENQYSDFSL